MHKHCPNCGLDLNPEPGFYWGAMYISYGFNAGIAIVASLILYFFFNNPVMEVYIVVVLAASTLLGSVVIRYSRLIMLYGLGEAKFKPELFHKSVEASSENLVTQ